MSATQLKLPKSLSQHPELAHQILYMPSTAANSFPHPITPSKCLKQHQTCTRFLSRMKTNYLQSLLATFDSKTRRAITRSVGSKSSSWLTVLPITRHQFDLSAAEFHDSLALRCHRPLFPANCDGCGDVFNLTHALDCRKGGLVTQRHNEVRDAIGDLASLVYKEVMREPIVQEANDACGIPSLVADLDQYEGYGSLKR